MLVFLLVLFVLLAAAIARNETSGGSNGSTSTLVGEDDLKRMQEEEARERQKAQAEARKRRRQREREREGMLAAKLTLQAGASEACDWRGQPLAFIKGQVCGAHYKVLGMDRRKGLPDKSEIKKAYRQRSLAVHPDKNPALEASAAFKIVNEAYECLVDDSCKSSYDGELARAEEEIQFKRIALQERVVKRAVEVASQAHYYLSIAANHIYQTGMDLWDLAGKDVGKMLSLLLQHS